MNYTNESFLQMRNQMINHFNNNMKGHTLFRVDISNNRLYNYYLSQFPDEIKEVYRSKAWHDCSACQKFFRKMANVVAMTEDRKIISLFDFKTSPEYQGVMDSLSNMVHNKPIKDVFATSQERIGISENFEHHDNGDVEQHNHFYLDIPEQYRCVSPVSFIAEYKTDYEVLLNAVLEIEQDAVKNVIFMIDQGILYRGAEWKHILIMFKKLQRDFYGTDDYVFRNHLIWSYVTSPLGRPFSHIKNHSIGVLLKDLTNNVDEETAIKRYEIIMAPSNYQRPKPVFTKEMLENARKVIDELGYTDSILRKYATIDDINVNDILFINRNIKKPMENDDPVDALFDDLEKDSIVKPQSLSHKNIETISLTDFVENIVPTAESIELYFDGKLRNNLVSLIAPVNTDSPSMFKWDNNFSWAYRSNLSDSIKERVRKAGGSVDGDLRFSIQWNNDGLDNWNKCDYDAHCTTPDHREIFFSNMYDSVTKGHLDVDIINPSHNVPAVENITFPSRDNMIDGEYLFRVHCYTARSGNNGFEAEIEYDGNIHSFDYPYSVQDNKMVDVAIVSVKDGEFSINNLLSSVISNKKIWNLTMNQFVPIQLVCYSPNFWNENHYGNKHIFFMAQDCASEVQARPWFNEFLNNDLHGNKKVMEALAAKAEVEVDDNQLSGFGFSSTIKTDFVVRINDSQLLRVQL